MTHGDLARILADAKARNRYSYESFSAACGGTPSGKRLFQLINEPLKNFPDPDTIRGLAAGTRLTSQEIVLAAARSLGLAPVSQDRDAYVAPGLDRLPDSLREAFLNLGRELGGLDVTKVPHEADPNHPVTLPSDELTGRRNTGKGQKNSAQSRDLSKYQREDEIPLPENWRDLAAGAPHESQIRRDREWSELGEESQDQP